MKDYYKILNVPHNANDETIHDAYRRAAKKYHPDVAETGNHERFLEVREAYEVLSDPEKRRKYDLARSRDYYNRWRNRQYGRVRQPDDVRVVRAELILSPSEAYRGGVFTVDVPVFIRCPICRGDWWLSWQCINCSGRGFLAKSMPVDVNVPPRVIPGMIIFQKFKDITGQEFRLELVCKIRRPSRSVWTYW